jgi:hypothetical protein
MDKAKEKMKLRAGAFIVNNGRVLAIINILRNKYNPLRSVEQVLKGEGIDQSEFLDSVNFLSEEQYIHLRDIERKEKAGLADANFLTLEAKITGKGIRLLGGGITDNMIELGG